MTIVSWEMRGAGVRVEGGKAVIHPLNAECVVWNIKVYLKQLEDKAINETDFIILVRQLVSNPYWPHMEEGKI